MIAVLQRVKQASVSVDGVVRGSCGEGLSILLGVANGDTEADAEALAEKIVKLTNSKSEIVFAPERPGDIRHSLACVDKLAATGFVGEWDFERGLAAAIEAYTKENSK